MEKIIGEGQKFERIRRVTGYLAGDVSRFNNGKRAEERETTSAVCRPGKCTRTGLSAVSACNANRK